MRHLCELLVLSVFALAAVANAEEIEEIVGWVSDESCGALHTQPGGEDCVQKCIKGAPHLNPEWVAQRMVFVTDGEEIWLVSNPEFLRGEEGKHLRVEVVRIEDGEGRSLRVLSKDRIEDDGPLR